MKLFDMPGESDFAHARLLSAEVPDVSYITEADFRKSGSTFAVLPASKQGEPDVFSHLFIPGYRGQFKDGDFYQFRNFSETVPWAKTVIREAVAEKPINLNSLSFAIGDATAYPDEYRENGFTEDDVKDALMADFALTLEKISEQLGIAAG